jgi:hypothetical protein
LVENRRFPAPFPLSPKVQLHTALMLIFVGPWAAGASQKTAGVSGAAAKKECDKCYQYLDQST